jgi:hypothetical protein
MNLAGSSLLLAGWRVLIAAIAILPWGLRILGDSECCCAASPQATEYAGRVELESVRTFLRPHFLCRIPLSFAFARTICFAC